jgi:hypothetical protein
MVLCILWQRKETNTLKFLFWFLSSNFLSLGWHTHTYVYKHIYISIQVCFVFFHLNWTFVEIISCKSQWYYYFSYEILFPSHNVIYQYWWIYGLSVAHKYSLIYSYMFLSAYRTIRLQNIKFKKRQICIRGIFHKERMVQFICILAFVRIFIWQTDNGPMNIPNHVALLQ